tara:strand:- start:234 stop:914 length:681 start_codon:yes stop_codon:yes gene_type:complete
MSSIDQFKNITLEQWQKLYKPISNLIVQASIKDSSSKNEKFNFSIGMQYSYLNLEKEIRRKIQFGKHKKIVLCAISQDTDKKRRGKKNISRKIILHNLFHNKIYNHRMDSNDYYHRLSRYKFIISPEGNGIDCHRHYESLLSGCIPIIEHNEFMKIKYQNLPILYTYDYSEITKKYLIEKYNEFKEQKYDFSKLFLSGHTLEDQLKIKDFGNYWCIRRAKKRFYKH